MTNLLNIGRAGLASKTAHISPVRAACIRTIRLFHHAGNFGRKIVGALLQAFALLKTHELDNLDVRAQLFSGVLNILETEISGSLTYA